MHYNNEKTDKYRFSGLLVLLFMLYLCFALLTSLESGLTMNLFNSICTVCKSPRIT